MIKAVRQNKKTEKWEFDYEKLNGKRGIKKGFNTKDEALRAQAKLNEELNKGLNPINKKTTMEEAGELYLNLHSSINCKSSTHNTYCGYLKNHINPFFGKRNINEITPMHIKAFMKQMQDNGLGNNSINKLVKLISAIYNFMIDSDIAVKNPVSRIKALKIKKNEEIRPLSTEETKILLSKAKQIYPDFYPLLFTAIFTGMRRGELLALTWDSINWVKGKIKVDKNYVGGKIGLPKNGKIRYVDMSSELARILKEWRLACPHSDKNLVFPNSSGNYMSPDNMVKRRYKPILNRAGIDERRFHDLRHTYASLLFSKNAQMKYVQTQLGHSTIQMTMDLYTHIMPEANDKCVNLLNDIVSTIVEPQEIKKYGT